MPTMTLKFWPHGVLSGESPHAGKTKSYQAVLNLSQVPMINATGVVNLESAPFEFCCHADFHPRKREHFYE